MDKKNNHFSVDVKNLTVEFGEFVAVDNISFSVRRGEIFGFLGANGAGKTTTIRVLCGLLRPTSGFVTVGDVAFESENEESYVHNKSFISKVVKEKENDEMKIKSNVGYMSQKFTLYEDLTVEENLSFIASLRKMNKKDYLQRRDFILNFISFKKPIDSFVRDLPGGIKQQVSLAGAILHDPGIIFLDEPTAGVSPYMRARFWALIRDLAKLGKTVFVTTHHIDEAEQCERIALMRNGKIIALDSPNNLKKTTFPTAVYELESRKNMRYSKLEEIKKMPFVDYFEPYGIRFHISFQQFKEVEKLKESLSKNFKIKEIEPSLEDVFIKMVEEKLQ